MFLQEFLTIAIVHLVAVVSPGPDFAVVVRHSVHYGRRIAMITSLGIGAAILLHVAYSLVGLSVIIKTTPWLYATFSYAAAAYLLYLAYGALKSGPAKDTEKKLETAKSQNNISLSKAFGIGFLTNGLNPKATLFFLSLFTAIINADTPFSIKLGYGVYLALATAIWFCFLSYLLSTSKVAKLIGEKGYWLDRTMGVLLVGLAIKLVVM
ncbi:LysE family translocator [Aestuariibacter sp. A3R04]|uniref:LysE family translocator n=1 Tax=Aestuariibacter sp. A3R04 TaxID=2841571 RepID=UPI001C0A101A|nr:LysE family translocator [Aestuariibacter sp. A3R04]MBU3022838.1 LysE family translocator [Aestuariibacter sp. A3R04]